MPPQGRFLRYGTLCWLSAHHWGDFEDPVLHVMGSFRGGQIFLSSPPRLITHRRKLGLSMASFLRFAQLWPQGKGSTKVMSEVWKLVKSAPLDTRRSSFLLE